MKVITRGLCIVGTSMALGLGGAILGEKVSSSDQEMQTAAQVERCIKALRSVPLAQVGQVPECGREALGFDVSQIGRVSASGEVIGPSTKAELTTDLRTRYVQPATVGSTQEDARIFFWIGVGLGVVASACMTELDEDPAWW